jgi:hypothetical protein
VRDVHDFHGHGEQQAATKLRYALDFGEQVEGVVQSFVLRAPYLAGCEQTQICVYELLGFLGVEGTVWPGGSIVRPLAWALHRRRYCIQGAAVWGSRKFVAHDGGRYY